MSEAVSRVYQRAVNDRFRTAPRSPSQAGIDGRSTIIVGEPCASPPISRTAARWSMRSGWPPTSSHARPSCMTVPVTTSRSMRSSASAYDIVPVRRNPKSSSSPSTQPTSTRPQVTSDHSINIRENRYNFNIRKPGISTWFAEWTSGRLGLAKNSFGSYSSMFHILCEVVR
jgi:hypothetical protein